MKIFFILNDSVPYGNQLDKYLENKGCKALNQITNCFTTTSVVALLTGKMPSDLVPGGIAYHTHYKYKKEGAVNYPWKNQLLFKKLDDKGWVTYIHNASWFYLTICDDEYICKSTSLDCGVVTADEFKATEKFTKILLTNTIENNSFYSRNKQYIESAQEDVGLHEFHFIKNHQYHQALATGGDLNNAIDRIKLNLDYIDFNSPDTLFYIFSDHHNFLDIDELCKCPSFLTKAYIKDNRAGKQKINFSCIHISDMFNYVLHDILPKEDRNRIYFSEDARVNIDPDKSTTAIASKFIDWVDDKPTKVIQVSYFRHRNKYYGFIYDLKLNKISECDIDTALKLNLKGRFGWVQ